jgi:hypothetical protein
MNLKKTLPTITAILPVIAAGFLAVSAAIDNVSLNTVPAGLQQAVLFIKRELEEFLTIEENIEEESKDD